MPECSYVSGKCVPDNDADGDQAECLKRCAQSPCCETCMHGQEIIRDCPAPPMCPDGSRARPAPGECCAGPQDCPQDSVDSLDCSEIPNAKAIKKQKKVVKKADKKKGSAQKKLDKFTKKVVKKADKKKGSAQK